LLRICMFVFFVIFNIMQNFLHKIGVFKLTSVALFLAMTFEICLEPIVANRSLLLVFDDIEIVYTMLGLAFLNYLTFVDYFKIFSSMLVLSVIPRLIIFYENFIIHIIFLLFVTIILLYYVHTKYKESIESFNNKRKLIVKKAEQESVVMYLLPAHVINIKKIIKVLG
jgi:hypothetical protein